MNRVYSDGLDKNPAAKTAKDAEVSTSSRQRVLCQKIAMLALRLAYSRSRNEKASLRGQLLDAVALLETNHNGLIDGDRSLNLAGTLSAESQEIYFHLPIHLDRQVRDYIAAARSLTQIADTELAPEHSCLEYILRSSSTELLAGLDAAFAQCQKESAAEKLALEQEAAAQAYQSALGEAVTCNAAAVNACQPIENALRQQVEQERLLNQVINQIRLSLELPAILKTAVEQVRQLLKVDRLIIYQFQSLPSQTEIEMQLAESQQMGPSCQLPSLDYAPARITYESRASDAISSVLHLQEVSCFVPEIDWCWEENSSTILAIDDTAEACQHSCLTWWQENQVRAQLATPIIVNKKIWGLLIAQQCFAPRPWLPREQAFLKNIGEHLAIAIYKAELYHQSQLTAAIATTQARQLHQALKDLQAAQAQLVQTEKMATLGQMVAGVAHEINNPVSFIYGNLEHTSKYIQDLLELVRLYQEEYPQPQPRVLKHSLACDLEFLVEDLPKMLASMKIGADRIRQIVLSLRNFSRLDEADMKFVDLHEGIDSTLLILQNRFKAQGNRLSIEAIKEYGNLPLVECYAGAINQVFMNLISNAIDVLEEDCQRGAIANPTIWIRTCVLDSNRVAACIADNGRGMSEAVRSRIFDPFFTTKPIGKGTGLGLPISHQIIVEKHGGNLYCHSAPGKGTEFWLEIPARQSKAVSLSFEQLNRP